MFVHPDSWGTNAARLLTDAAIGDLRDRGCAEVWLWVLEANGRARAFYQRYGFAETPARTASSLDDLPELAWPSTCGPGTGSPGHRVTGSPGHRVTENGSSAG
ncbi:GNAT family N-acetyltransferase [Kribbella qitaiheensis]|uniref:GNAT family N-acetyltransferase n=1 Tax=Kribbella qitaiheensis TaxID=1544730 RepID=UPI003D18960E